MVGGKTTSAAHDPEQLFRRRLLLLLFESGTPSGTTESQPSGQAWKHAASSLTSSKSSPSHVAKREDRVFPFSLSHNTPLGQSTKPTTRVGQGLSQLPSSRPPSPPVHQRESLVGPTSPSPNFALSPLPLSRPYALGNKNNSLVIHPRPSLCLPAFVNEFSITSDPLTTVSVCRRSTSPSPRPLPAVDQYRLCQHSRHEIPPHAPAVEIMSQPTGALKVSRVTGLSECDGACAGREELNQGPVMDKEGCSDGPGGLARARELPWSSWVVAVIFSRRRSRGEDPSSPSTPA